MDTPIRIARGELVPRQTERIDVAAIIGSPEGLWGHVNERSEHIAGDRQVRQLLHLGQAEIGDPDGPSCVEEQIPRLDPLLKEGRRLSTRRFGRNLRATRAGQQAKTP